MAETDKFKVDLIYLVPILASLLFGLGLSYLLQPPHQVLPAGTNTTLIIPENTSITPVQPSTPGAPVYDGLYFVILLAISASLFYILIKHRSKHVITGLIAVALTAATLLLSYIYLYALSVLLPVFTAWVIPLTVGLTILVDYIIFRAGSNPRNILVILLGGALGVFLGRYLPLWSAIVILVFLAIYDIIAVYRGPVGKIAESASGLDELRGLSYSFKDVQMGLGDLVFYSALSACMFFAFDIIACLVSIIGILIGSIITLFMLEKRGVFPGLPFPILLGLAGGLITGIFILPLL